MSLISAEYWAVLVATPDKNWAKLSMVRSAVRSRADAPGQSEQEITGFDRVCVLYLPVDDNGIIDLVHGLGDPELTAKKAHYHG